MAQTLQVFTAAATIPSLHSIFSGQHAKLWLECLIYGLI